MPNPFFDDKQVVHANENDLRAVWSEHETAAEFLSFLHLDVDPYSDLALFVVRVNKPAVSQFNPSYFKLDCGMPKIGERVELISFTHAKDGAREIQEPVKKDGEGQIISLSRCPTRLEGVVTGVYPDGYRQYRWPCFTTSIPAAPGQSGGCVIRMNDDHSPVALGVVTADSSRPEAFNDNTVGGDSLISSLWPAVRLTIPERLPSRGGDEITLHELIRDAWPGSCPGGVEHIVLNPAKPPRKAELKYLAN